MAIQANIIAKIKRPNLIIANTVPLTTTQSNPPIELKNAAHFSTVHIRDIVDVVEDHPIAGDTLVYNADTQKYEVKPVSLGSLILDGGSF